MEWFHKKPEETDDDPLKKLLNHTIEMLMIQCIKLIGIEKLFPFSGFSIEGVPEEAWLNETANSEGRFLHWKS